MRRKHRLMAGALSALIVLINPCDAATAASNEMQGETVHFASLAGPRPAMLDARLYRAHADDDDHSRRPAIVFLHGCGGLFNRHRAVNAREREWAQRLNAVGINVLMVDSFDPRQHGEMCAPAHFDASIYRTRPFDAYAALTYLQAQDFVRGDRIGLMGWSEGGGTLLNAIHANSEARSAALHEGIVNAFIDFKAAVAFYPASCSTKRQGGEWTSAIPLLVLIGASDVWAPAQPCSDLITHHDPSTQAEIHVYANAYHDFDWPGMPVHEVPAFRTRRGVIPIEGMNEEAKADVVHRVIAFWTEQLMNR